MTREDDRYLVLKDRYEIARKMRAELFISIHADAAPSNDGARGATIYTLSEVASDREAALLAEQQNRSDRIAARTEWTPESTNPHRPRPAPEHERLCGVRGFAEARGSAYSRSGPNYHRFASLVVLKAPDVPSTCSRPAI